MDRLFYLVTMPWAARPGTRHHDGQGLAEYALVLALIAVVAIVALVFLGGQVKTIISRAGKSI